MLLDYTGYLGPNIENIVSILGLIPTVKVCVIPIKQETTLKANLRKKGFLIKADDLYKQLRELPYHYLEEGLEFKKYTNLFYINYLKGELKDVTTFLLMDLSIPGLDTDEMKEQFTMNLIYNLAKIKGEDPFEKLGSYLDLSSTQVELLFNLRDDNSRDGLFD